MQEYARLCQSMPEYARSFFGRRYQSLPVCCKVPKLPEFQKFFGRRYQSLPVCCQVTSYQSFRSFLVADTDLCLSVAKLQVTRVPEVFWSQIPISACMFQSSQVTRVPEVFWLQIS